MPLQNRVDPFGQLRAITDRGTRMGNRGCLHNADQQIVRQYQSRRWIICVLAFKGRRRLPMPVGQYTALFFLDEATALAAGHRPCAECQRARFNDFRAHWAAANLVLAHSAAPPATTIDAALHHERISAHRRQRDTIKLTYQDQLAALPDGTCILLDAPDTPYLVRGDALYPWDMAGYRPPIARPKRAVQVLTPRSTVRALAHGYLPQIHATAF